jgi:prophage regulatory protein
MNKLIKIEKVQEMTLLSRASIYRLVSIGVFPKQFKLSLRASAWVEQEVLDWIDERISVRDKQEASQTLLTKKVH